MCYTASCRDLCERSPTKTLNCHLHAQTSPTPSSSQYPMNRMASTRSTSLFKDAFAAGITHKQISSSHGMLTGHSPAIVRPRVGGAS